MKATLSAIIALAWSAGAGAAATCRALDHDGRSYAVCEAEAGADVRLWLSMPDGQPIGTFDRLRELLGGEGLRLVFAMNAGMYHPDRLPVGLYVEAGREVAPIVTAAGPGNFGMRPNGVFCVGAGSFAVIESRAFRDSGPGCDYATQSGPMLLIDGAPHPRFLRDSDSRHIRNGVGVSADGRKAWFAISDVPVTFWEFAGLFRDGLGAQDALYFDGSVSRLYSADLAREDLGFPMGPIVGLVVPAG